VFRVAGYVLQVTRCLVKPDLSENHSFYTAFRIPHSPFRIQEPLPYAIDHRATAYKKNMHGCQDSNLKKIMVSNSN